MILAAPVDRPPLNGGIQLKRGQRLIGAGPAVAGRTTRRRRLPELENTTGAHLDGDAIRLADHTTVSNVVVRSAYRGDMYGLDSVGVKIKGNDISGQNTSCTKGFLVQPFNVPTGIPGSDLPASPAVAPQNGWAGIMVDGQRAAGRITISGNYIHDGACGDGVDIRAMGSSRLTAVVDRNSVTRLAQGAGLTSVLAIGMQALDSAVLRVSQDRDTETYIGSSGADCEGQFANTAGSGRIYDTVNHNRFAHAIGGTSCNGFETIISSGDGTIDLTLKNSTFRDNVGDMFEEGNLGTGSTMRFVAQTVLADGTSVRGGNPPGSSDGGANPIPFNIGDCMVAGNDGAADSTTFVMRDSVFRHCNNGISLLSNVGLGNGSGSTRQLIGDVRNSVITANAKYGIHVASDTPIDQLEVKVAHTEISHNGEPGASFEAQAGAISSASQARLDLGGGGLVSSGQNCLFGNGSADVEATNLPVAADRDWWGQPGGPKPSQTRTGGIGSISSSGGLTGPPTCR